MTSNPPAGPAGPAAPDHGREPYDPLQLCIFATVALLGWVFGPVALLGFAGLGLVAYTRARLQGLTRSRCVLRDTRLVIGYLALLALAGLGGVVQAVRGVLG